MVGCFGALGGGQGVVRNRFVVAVLDIITWYRNDVTFANEPVFVNALARSFRAYARRVGTW
jgi:hypothetical protein